MYSLHSIAETVDGRVDGDADYKIYCIRSLDHATSDSLSFLSDSSREHLLENSQAGALILTSEYSDRFPGNKIIVNDPYLAYAKASRLFARRSTTAVIADTAIVSGECELGENVSLGNHSTIGQGSRIGNDTTIGSCVTIGENVEIGADTVIEDQVTIFDGCRIGRRCCISPGVVIGSSGFGYAPDGEKWEKIEQLGSVVIGDNVDIGAKTCIDRGALGNTVIGNGVKLDNLIQIAHNVSIGENTIVAAFAGIAGSAQIGNRCKLGGRTNIMGHVEICDDVTVMATSFVTGSISSPGEYSSALGVQPAQQWRKTAALVRRLDNLAQKVKQISKENNRNS
jgi:UDP-3-O-[3-hydroxymyristoyl] glucosamine N-acyltransferase